MRQSTHALLATLERVEWFSSVGQPVDDPTVRTLGSWQEAIASCQTDRWNYVTLEAKNIFTKALASDYMDEYRRWNQLAAELKAVHEPLIERKSSQVIAACQLPKAVHNCVRWDILMACMEQEYFELIAPGFFSRLGQLYIEGHFPCGWEGPFPGTGLLLVY